MDALILLVCFLGPAVVTYLLRKTPACWLPGAVMVIVGIAKLGAISQYHGDDSVVGAWRPIGDAIEGVFLLGYGLLCLAVIAVSWRAVRTPAAPPAVAPLPAVELPPAVVVSDVSRI